MSEGVEIGIGVAALAVVALLFYQSSSAAAVVAVPAAVVPAVADPLAAAPGGSAGAAVSLAMHAGSRAVAPALTGGGAVYSGSALLMSLTPAQRASFAQSGSLTLTPSTASPATLAALSASELSSLTRGGSITIGDNGDAASVLASGPVS
jgi:hypothetical protein